MKETVNEHRFIDGFRECDRNENFTYDGRRALYEYLTDLEDGLREELEYDPIGICCVYTEFESIEEFNECYGKEYEDYDALEEDGICFFLRVDIEDYFAEGHSFTNPKVTEHIIVEDF